MNADATQQPTRPIREEHRELLSHLDHVRGMMDALRERQGPEEVGALQHAVDFFHGLLKPHAEWEEEHLYPVVDTLIRQYGRPTATMSVDHRFLVAKMDAFAREAAALRGAAPGEAAVLADRVRRLGYRIEALLELHFRKEEDVYLDEMDRHLSTEDVRRLLATAAPAHGHHHHG